MAELLCRYYHEQHGLEVRVARYHNVYGPDGTYEGGREKAPAALCRKVALTPPGGAIEVWGDGSQTRSFCYVDDCVEGTYRLMRSDHREPLNIGSDRLVTIDQLARLVFAAAGRDDIAITHVEGPQGVRGRNSDNTLLRSVLGWEPAVPLEKGLLETYRWIADELGARSSLVSAPAGRLALFDLDGTLVRPGSVLQRMHMDSMVAAIAAASGSREPFTYRGGELFYRGVNLAGFTDAGTIQARARPRGRAAAGGRRTTSERSSRTWSSS